MCTKEIIVTGFEPFGGSDVNPSAKICEKLKSKKISDYKIKTFVIPLEFQRINSEITKIFADHNPSAFIAVGQSNRSRISLERVALNFVDARIPYNCGSQPKEQVLFKGEPVAYWTTLPVVEIKKNLIEQKIPVEMSYFAGTYGCNQIFYTLMRHVNKRNLNIPAGFIHVPSLPEQVVERDVPSMSIELIIKGMLVIIETVIHLIEQQNESK